jgi:hypothetical protein
MLVMKPLRYVEEVLAPRLLVNVNCMIVARLCGMCLCNGRLLWLMRKP